MPPTDRHAAGAVAGVTHAAHGACMMGLNIRGSDDGAHERLRPDSTAMAQSVHQGVDQDECRYHPCGVRWVLLGNDLASVPIIVPEELMGVNEQSRYNVSYTDNSLG
ncbi:MAG: hypothetical protein MI924_33360 [Chloroflexales bacterium]|nr:hypothetical protein [Chloroflexales bacterium]